LTTPTSRIRDGTGADRGHGEQPADLAVERAPAQLTKRGVEALDVSNRGLDVRPCADLDDPPRLRDGRRERLLDEHRDAGPGELLGDWQMELGGNRHDREVEGPTIEEIRHGVEHERRVVDGPVGVAARVNGAGERDPFQCLEQPRVVPAHHAEPDHATVQPRLSPVGYHRRGTVA
jgi:hypothetical protein